MKRILITNIIVLLLAMPTFLKAQTVDDSMFIS